MDIFALIFINHISFWLFFNHPFLTLIYSRNSYIQLIYTLNRRTVELWTNTNEKKEKRNWNQMLYKNTVTRFAYLFKKKILRNGAFDSSKLLTLLVDVADVVVVLSPLFPCGNVWWNISLDDDDNKMIGEVYLRERLAHGTRARALKKIQLGVQTHICAQTHTHTHKFKGAAQQKHATNSLTIFIWIAKCTRYCGQYVVNKTQILFDHLFLLTWPE